jgi:hypothetical protein
MDIYIYFFFEGKDLKMEAAGFSEFFHTSLRNLTASHFKTSVDRT